MRLGLFDFKETCDILGRRSRIFLKSRQKVAVAASLIFLLSIAIQYLGFTNQKDYFEFFCWMHTIMAVDQYPRLTPNYAASCSS